jgi:hypothetical protein
MRQFGKLIGVDVDLAFLVLQQRNGHRFPGAFHTDPQKIRLFPGSHVGHHGIFHFFLGLENRIAILNDGLLQQRIFRTDSVFNSPVVEDIPGKSGPGFPKKAFG